MAQESSPLLFFVMLLGNTMNIHQEFLKRMKQRLRLTEVKAMENSHVILAFLPISSRAGTDIAAGLKKIPTTGQPVILVVLHFTIDENHVAPESRQIIDRSDVHAVDVLCYEDLGLLRCLHNDEALKSVTDHLISLGGSPNTQSETSSLQRRCPPWLFYSFIVFFIIIVLLIALALGFYFRDKSSHISPTQLPNTTIHTVHQP